MWQSDGDESRVPSIAIEIAHLTLLLMLALGGGALVGMIGVVVWWVIGMGR
jgi:hypothetical protein